MFVNIEISIENAIYRSETLLGTMVRTTAQGFLDGTVE
jgi:hypothetical protein